MSARVLFACWPFEGHVFPQLSIALALRAQGHEVAFYTGPELQSAVEGQGVHVFPFQRVAHAWRDVRDREREVGGRKQSMRVQQQAFREWLVETIPGQVSDLQDVIAAWSPDAIVTDASMWGPSLVLGESVPIPVALASPLIGALIPGPDGPPPGSGLAPARDARGRLIAAAVTRVTELVARGLRARLDELRAGYGLGPMGCGVNEFMGRLPLYLALTVPDSTTIAGISRRACTTSAPACGIRPSRRTPAPGWTASPPSARGSTSPTAPRTSRIRSCCARRLRAWPAPGSR